MSPSTLCKSALREMGSSIKLSTHARNKNPFIPW